VALVAGFGSLGFRALFVEAMDLAMSETEEILSKLSAMIAGDRWLSASGCAALMDIKKRTFLERIACRPDFPAASKILGNQRVWLKSEVNQWIESRRVNRAA
jgi:predicted DNA-binding transcriptional regulator AlpA